LCRRTWAGPVQDCTRRPEQVCRRAQADGPFEVCARYQGPDESGRDRQQRLNKVELSIGRYFLISLCAHPVHGPNTATLVSSLTIETDHAQLALQDDC